MKKALPDLAAKASLEFRRGFSSCNSAVEDIIFGLPFQQPVKQIGVIFKHMPQLSIAGIGAKPTAISPAMIVDGR